MSRVSSMVRIACLLTISVTAVASQSPADLNPDDTGVPGPTYKYSLVEGQSLPVCKHMLGVFNSKFANLWNPPDLISPTGTPNYSANSKLVFPLLPGVKHSAEASFQMRLSAWPASPVFAAIHWREGRAVFGGCPKGKTCGGEGPVPILVAYFDFDNDGTTDTVVQLAFISGKYSTEDVFDVWRGQALKMDGAPSLWALQHPQNKELTPIMMQATYLRPFIYHGITYAATYKPHFAPTHGEYETSPIPLLPLREDMFIGRYHFAGRRDQIGRPEWSSDTVCDLRMKRQKY